MKMIVSVLALALMSVPACAEVVHKCKDAQGKTLYQSAPCARGDVAVSAWATSAQLALDPEDADKPAEQRMLVLRQQSNGHYFVEGVINGKSLNFVVDTGASMVALPRNLAYSANMSCQEQVRTLTANGAGNACASIIARLKVGPFLFKDVPAMIVPNLSQSLLGMNVLQQFRIEQDNGEMRLIPKK